MMNCNTSASAIERAGAGSVFELGSLAAALARIPDRRKRRGVRFPLMSVLVIIVLAKLAGEDQPTGMAEWAQARAAWLLPALGLKREKLPHRTTYGRVLKRAIRVEDLEQVAREFLARQPACGTAVVISLDGKTLRGTIPPGQTRGVHLLAAYLPEAGVVLMQVEVESKENEIPAALTVLQALDLNGKIVRGDALLTQRALSDHIVAAGGDYVWTVKENQPQLREDIVATFQPAPCAPGFSSGPTDFQMAATVNKGHGRTETRTLTTSSSLRGFLDWPGMAQVFQLERLVHDHLTDEVRCEVVYGLTSLTAAEAGPRRLLHLVRLHWGIENGLHYRRDVTFKEDACRLRQPVAQRILATLNNLILGLLLGRGVTNVPQARRRFAAHPAEALTMLSGSP
jgi:predicted transposase YbfD/YdcC